MTNTKGHHTWIVGDGRQTLFRIRFSPVRETSRRILVVGYREDTEYGAKAKADTRKGMKWQNWMLTFGMIMKETARHFHDVHPSKQVAVFINGHNITRILKNEGVEI